jgi:guanylate kinase
MTLRPIVISGPSGVGKSTVLKRLMSDFPNSFGFSVSHTSRNPRDGEKDGIDYHFSSKEVMQSEVDQGLFIESATFGGNMYGTSKKAVRDVSDQNKICILDIDEQGVKNLKSITDINPLYCFIKPPSIQILEERLRGRGTETEESFQKRMATAKSAIDYADSGVYDCIVVNDDFDRCYQEFVGFLKSHYQMLRGIGGEGDGPGSQVKPEATVLTVESSVPGHGEIGQHPDGTWWCTML